LIGEQGAVSNYIATQTGGRYLRVTPKTYAKGLEEILQQLHCRYELGFKPEALDGKRHKFRVELAAAAKNRHKGVRLNPAPPMYRSLLVSDTDEKITEMRPTNVKQLHRSENSCGRL
jgi:hypothetical protein